MGTDLYQMPSLRLASDEEREQERKEQLRYELTDIIAGLSFRMGQLAGIQMRDGQSDRLNEALTLLSAARLLVEQERDEG